MVRKFLQGSSACGHGVHGLVHLGEACLAAHGQHPTCLWCLPLDHSMLCDAEPCPGMRSQHEDPMPGSVWPHAGLQGRAVEVLHLERVVRPPQSKRHPMAGLWKADYGPDGVQIILISYDFTGPAARIVAIKVAIQCYAHQHRCRTVLRVLLAWTRACQSNHLGGKPGCVLHCLPGRDFSRPALQGLVCAGDRGRPRASWQAHLACGGSPPEATLGYSRSRPGGHAGTAAAAAGSWRPGGGYGVPQKREHT